MSSFQPKILAFLCNWCSYAGADLAGVSRIQYPPTTRVVRVPCSGRVNPFFMLKALQIGADGVLVSGCHPGDCHYITGNYYARRRFSAFKDLMDFLGFPKERLNFAWCSAAEGQKFADVVKETTDRVASVGKNDVYVKREFE